MPKLRVVTPTEQDTPSIGAFYDQLTSHDGWANIDYYVYAANNNNSKLAGLVQQAVDDAPDVIVAAGSTAAGILQYVTTRIAIVQAVGGEIPANKKNNLTGYQHDAKTIAEHHLNHLSAQKITVLYDDTNDPSIDVYNYLVTKVPGGKQLIPLPVSDPADFTQFAKTPAKFTDGFMLIPNAMYYKHCNDLVTMVDGNVNVKDIYYPEREFLNAHKKNKSNVKVHGHKILDTFRAAADLVDKIFKGQYKPNDASWPDFQEAVKDP